MLEKEGFKNTKEMTKSDQSAQFVCLKCEGYSFSQSIDRDALSFIPQKQICSWVSDELPTTSSSSSSSSWLTLQSGLLQRPIHSLFTANVGGIRRPFLFQSKNDPACSSSDWTH